MIKKGTKYQEVVDGMEFEEANQVGKVAREQFGTWATFTLAKRPAEKVRPGFVAGYHISYVTIIEFDKTQPFQINSYLRGYLAGLRR